MTTVMIFYDRQLSKGGGFNVFKSLSKKSGYFMQRHLFPKCNTISRSL